MNIFQIIAIAIVGAVLAIMLKSYKPELAIGVSVITGIILLFLSVNGIREVFYEFEYIIEKSGVDIRYFEIIIKVIGIAYVTQFAAEICRDGGQNSIAMKLEMIGKIFIMILTVPIIKSFLDLVISILN